MRADRSGWVAISRRGIAQPARVLAIEVVPEDELPLSIVGTPQAPLILGPIEDHLVFVPHFAVVDGQEAVGNRGCFRTDVLDGIPTLRGFVDASYPEIAAVGRGGVQTPVRRGRRGRRPRRRSHGERLERGRGLVALEDVQNVPVGAISERVVGGKEARAQKDLAIR